MLTSRSRSLSVPHSQRPQDGNFNGGAIAYYDHVEEIGDTLTDHFEFF